ncbi:MAG TPA: hypothetical protein VMX97_09580 [Hyphomicrobiaceae bacterium]|nr:hypothetical protein [Hyphomicrobiaceae bacterium]
MPLLYLISEIYDLTHPETYLSLTPPQASTPVWLSSVSTASFGQRLFVRTEGEYAFPTAAVQVGHRAVMRR